jgi:hypothetical protein
MEMYFQFDGASCMDLRYGRNFVMFVTMDAFRPRAAALGDLFRAKISNQSIVARSGRSNDPMSRSLMEFVQAAAQKRSSSSWFSTGPSPTCCAGKSVQHFPGRVGFYYSLSSRATRCLHMHPLMFDRNNQSPALATVGARRNRRHRRAVKKLIGAR